MSDIITIDTATPTAGGKKLVYRDTYGKTWVSWVDDIVLKEKLTYEIQDFKSKTWSPKGDPSKSFTDNVITKAREIPAHQAHHAPQQPPANLPQTNGHAAPNGNKDKSILTAVLAKMVAPIPFSNRDTMANQMTEIYLAAQDAYDRVVE